jgi:predicted MFS family arabinose efflux permease
LYVFSYFHRVAPVVVAGDLMQTFAIPAAALGTLIAVYPYCFVVMALPNGTLADTLGPRRMLALGGLIMAAGSILFGAAPVFSAAFIGRLLVGVGASTMLIASLRLASEWFRPHEFATVAGASQSIGAVGAIVGTGPLALLVEAIGWRWSYVGIGGVTAVLAAACFIFIRDKPEELGLPRVSEGPRAAAPSLGETLAAIPVIAGNRRSWPLLVMGATMYGSFVAFFGLWGVPYLTQVYGLPRVAASNVLMMTAVGLLLGAPLFGWVSDRWLGLRRPPVIAATALYAGIWALLALRSTPVPAAWLGALCFLLGFASGSVSLVFPCIREVNDPRHVGVALGAQNLPIFLGVALMQWLTGVMLDANWAGALAAGGRIYPLGAYRAAFGLCFGAASVSFFMACLITETRCRNVWAQARAHA